MTMHEYNEYNRIQFSICSLTKCLNVPRWYIVYDNLKYHYGTKFSLVTALNQWLFYHITRLAKNITNIIISNGFAHHHGTTYDFVTL